MVSPTRGATEHARQKQVTNPLTITVSALPAMGLLAIDRGIAFPLIVAGISICALLVINGAPSLRQLLVFTVVLPGLVLFVGLIFSLWYRPPEIGGAPPPHTEWWRPAPSQLRHGFATSMRLAALLLCGLVISTSTKPRQLILALITHIRIPYRAGYAVLIGTRLVPMSRSDLRTLRLARQLQGAPRSPRALLLPLIVSSLRRSNRMANAMESRAYGAYAMRTERQPESHFEARDALMIAASWLLAAIAKTHFDGLAI